MVMMMMVVGMKTCHPLSIPEYSVTRLGWSCPPVSTIFELLSCNLWIWIFAEYLGNIATQESCHTQEVWSHLIFFNTSCLLWSLFRVDLDWTMFIRPCNNNHNNNNNNNNNNIATLHHSRVDLDWAMTHSPLFQGETLFRRAINCEQKSRDSSHDKKNNKN